MTALRTAYLILGDTAEAEDVVQEAFVRAFRKLSTIREPAAFGLWFYKLLTNVARRHANRNGRKPQLFANLPDEGQGLVDEQPGPATLAARRAEDEALWKAVRSLDEVHRTTLVLRYYQDLSLEEIAEIMSCPLGTVKSRLYTTRQRLAKLLVAEDAGVP